MPNINGQSPADDSNRHSEGDAFGSMDLSTHGILRKVLPVAAEVAFTFLTGNSMAGKIVAGTVAAGFLMAEAGPPSFHGEAPVFVEPGSPEEDYLIKNSLPRTYLTDEGGSYTIDPNAGWQTG